MARILLADDDEIFRDAFRDGLEELGHKVVTVPTGADVVPEIRASETHPFDVVFLDMMMSGGGGITVLHAVREISATLPVVIITGRVELFGSPLFLDGMRSAQAKIHKSTSLIEIDKLIETLRL